MSLKIVCGVSSARLNWHVFWPSSLHVEPPREREQCLGCQFWSSRLSANPVLPGTAQAVTPTEGGVGGAVCCLAQWTSVASSSQAGNLSTLLHHTGSPFPSVLHF